MRDARSGGGRRQATPLTFACLGSSGAVPSATRDTTALAIRAGRTTCLIDVGGSPVQKLRRLGVDPVGLAAVVITHIHPDHVYGLPALIQNLLILRRRTPLPVYCRVEHVRRLRTLLELFDLARPRRGFAVQVAGVEAREQVVVLRTADLVMTTSPNVHGPMPNLAVRIDAGGGSLVYSSDTRPCREVERLARSATVLVHEATFDRPEPTQWHSTARQAGRVARAAGVRRLFLAHIGHALHGAVPRLVADARAAFGGPVRAVRELTWYRA